MSPLSWAAPRRPQNCVGAAQNCNLVGHTRKHLRSAELQKCAFRRCETARVHTTVSWPSRRSADKTDLGPLRRPPGRTWPVWLQVKRADNALTIRQTERSQASGWHAKTATPRCLLYVQLKLAAGLNHHRCVRGSIRAFQGLQLGPAAALACT